MYFALTNRDAKMAKKRLLLSIHLLIAEIAISMAIAFFGQSHSEIHIIRGDIDNWRIDIYGRHNRRQQILTIIGLTMIIFGATSMLLWLWYFF